MTSMASPPVPANPPQAEPLLFAGVDTHKNTHHVAVIDQVGRSVADSEFPATATGYRAIVEFLGARGLVQRVGVEGTGSYGAELARVLARAGIQVVEVVRQNRQHRRLKGKSDPLDAHQAALAVLADTGTATPKQRDGAVESLRILMAERHSAVKSRSQTMNQIHSLLVTAPEEVRHDYRAYQGDRLVAILARTRPATGTDPERVARSTLKRIATRHRALREEIAVIDRHLEGIIRELNPGLLAVNGIGIPTAAALLITLGDNPGRVRTKAQFAALCGVAPIPASSGQRIRHRLSRGGDRQANHALHRIVLLRIRHREPRTAAYVERRRTEGLSDRDIFRCLKRHIANEVYKTLTDPGSAVPATGPLLRQQRQAIGIPITVLADTLGVPYQRLRRLEIGTRQDPELEHRARQTLEQITQNTPPNAA